MCRKEKKEQQEENNSNRGSADDVKREYWEEKYLSCIPNVKYVTATLASNEPVTNTSCSTGNNLVQLVPPKKTKTSLLNCETIQ